MLSKQEFNKAQGAAIKGMRKMFNVKQSDLAKVIKRSPACISLIETGKHGISTFQMHQIHCFFASLKKTKE